MRTIELTIVKLFFTRWSSSSSRSRRSSAMASRSSKTPRTKRRKYSASATIRNPDKTLTITRGPSRGSSNVNELTTGKTKYQAYMAEKHITPMPAPHRPNSVANRTKGKVNANGPA